MNAARHCVWPLLLPWSGAIIDLAADEGNEPSSPRQRYHTSAADQGLLVGSAGSG